MYRRSALLVMAIAAVVIVTGGNHAVAEIHDGFVVSVTAGKLVTVDNVREYNYDVDLATKITLDGKKAKLAELRKGDLVRVAHDGIGKAIEIVALRKK
jgi:hypothetical protein